MSSGLKDSKISPDSFIISQRKSKNKQDTRHLCNPYEIIQANRGKFSKGKNSVQLLCNRHYSVNTTSFMAWRHTSLGCDPGRYHRFYKTGQVTFLQRSSFGTPKAYKKYSYLSDEILFGMFLVQGPFLTAPFLHLFVLANFIFSNPRFP